MNKKKALLIAVACVLAVALVVGGVFGVLKLRQQPVNVYALSDLASAGSLGTSTISGYVRADNVQSVFLTQTQTVTELLVTEGQSVKKGDVLLRYDTSLDSLQLERKNLEIQKLQRDLLHAKEDYNTLVGYQYFSLGACFGELVHLSAAPISHADISFLTDEEGTPETSTDPTGEPTSEPATEPTSEPTSETTGEPTQIGLQPDGSVIGYACVGGNATQDTPYLYVVADGIPSDSNFFSTLLGAKDTAYVVFVQCEDNMADGVVTGAWGMQLTRGESITISFFDAADYVGDTLENHGKPIDPEDPGGGGGGGGGMSYGELQKLKAEKIKEIEDYDLQIRMAQVEHKKMEKELGDGSVYAEVDGVVKALGDPETAYVDNQPVVKISGGGGYYIDGNISELRLDTVAVGQSVTVQSWMSGGVFEGKVDSVSNYPSSSSGWNEGNNNVTYYTFTVFVGDEADLQSDEYVDLSLGTADGSDSLYLEKPFVIQENGKSYVYVRGADEKLEKREITIGRELWGAIEIRGGVSMEDFIAFPYGKDVKQGAKTVESTVDKLYNYG